MLQVSEVRGWGLDEIERKIGELKLELFKVQVQQGAMGIEKPHLIKTHKKDIARLNTILREKK